jgi:hypothetical protein
MDPLAQMLVELAARVGGQCVSVAVSAVGSSAAIVVLANGVRWVYRTVAGGGVVREPFAKYAPDSDAGAARRAMRQSHFEAESAEDDAKERARHDW